MSGILRPFFPDNQLVVTLDIFPISGEENDLDTQALAQHIHFHIQQDLAHIEEYSVHIQSQGETGEQRRGLDLSTLLIALSAFSAGVAASKELLTSLFQMISTIVEALTKRGHIGEVEIIVDGTPIIVRDVNKKEVADLVSEVKKAIEETHKSPTLGKPLKMQARVSKRAKKRL